MKIHVINGGFFTTVQDEGRYGYLGKGIPASGVMDMLSYETANRLAGNMNGEAVLEMTVFGGSYSFDDDTVIAVTGAQMYPKANGKDIPMYETVKIEAGSTLSFASASNGCRTYLAVAGGIDVPEVMNSRSTYTKYGIGGYEGRKLRRGDTLKTGPVYGEVQMLKAGQLQKKYSDEISVRVIPGPQEDCFTSEGIKTFYNSEYTVSDKSDRMGYRMNGRPVESINGTDIVSDAAVFGSIQITGTGLPLILMADRQTTGGYAKIGTVFSEDLPELAQAKPGTIVRFVRINDNEWMKAGK